MNKKIKQGNQNIKFHTADIETKGGIGGSFLIGGIYDGKRYQEFHDEDMFMEHLISIKGIVFFHYGEFDFNFIIEWASKRNIKLRGTPIIANENMIILRLEGIKTTFKDSFFLLGDSLERLSQGFNTKIKTTKLKDYNLKKITPIVRKHLREDTISLHQVLTKFYDFIGWEFFNKRSIAAIGLEMFKRMYPYKYRKIVENPLYSNAYEFIKKGYFSSYSHIFKYKINNKNGEILKIDANSFFASMMRDNQYPYGSFFIIKSNDNIREFLEKGNLGVIRCVAKAPEGLQFGFLPMKVGKGVEYPIKGDIEGIYTTSEINYAEKMGYKFKFIKGIFWTEKDYLFKDFINHLYKVKKENKGTKQEIIKRLLVSFYGKFAQNRRISTLKNYKTPQAFKICINREFNLYEEDSYRFFDYSHPELSIFTTAYARIFLYKRMKEIGFGNIFSIMSDALIVKNLKNSFKDKWLSEVELGKFKVVFDIKDGVVLQKGVYALQDRNGNEIIKNQGGVREFNKTLKVKDFKKALRQGQWDQYTKEDKYVRMNTINSVLKGQVKKFREMKKLKRTIKIKNS